MAGDQLLKVDDQSLVGITQEKYVTQIFSCFILLVTFASTKMWLFCYRAAEYLVRTGPIVTLEVAKQGAIYHGLATLLSQPSPVMTRGW